MTPDSRTVCDVFITIVHGTWPRNVLRDVFLTPFYGRWPGGFVPKNLWFAAGSEFRNRLTAALSKRGLSAHISPFLWSGANSVRERDRAAHQLVEHIRAKQSDYPSSTQVIERTVTVATSCCVLLISWAPRVTKSLSQQSLHRSLKFCGPKSRLKRHDGLT